MIDKRGVGLSDRVAEPPSLEDRVADTLAVMDAQKLEVVDLVGHSEGGPIAVALSAYYPARVSSLIVLGAPALGGPREELALLADDSGPFPSGAEEAERFRALVRHWGSPESVNLDLFAPQVAHDAAIKRWYARFERQSASPGALLGFLRSVVGHDIRPLLPMVSARTLVVHARDDRMVHVAHRGFYARALAGARYIEYDLDDHAWPLVPQWRTIQDDMIEFVTGLRPALPVTAEFATVVFSDIVGSTRQGAAMGIEAWRTLMERHDHAAGRVVGGHSGRLVKYTGDGLLATFADPYNAVTAAVSLTHEIAQLGLAIRVGVHAGAVERRADGDISGVAVNVAARVQSHAEGGEVLVTATVRDLLFGTGHIFDDRGTHYLKGLEGPRHLFAAIDHAHSAER